MEFTNFTVNDNGNITKINATITCDNTGCNTSSDFTGADGHVHRVSDVSISGDPVNGFNGSMTFYHYTYGSVSVTAYNVMFGSCVDFPDGGSIDFTGTNGSYGSVNFASDCTYTGTYYDGVTSGSFSGSFN
jgi:hypothetical protein